MGVDGKEMARERERRTGKEGGGRMADPVKAIIHVAFNSFANNESQRDFKCNSLRCFDDNERNIQIGENAENMECALQNL